MMRHIDDERWNEMWSEKILAARQVLINANDVDMAKIFGMLHEMGSRRGSEGIRHSLIKSMRDMVKHNARYGNEVCYTLGGRYRLPYHVREVIWNAADVLATQVTQERLNQSPYQSLINFRTRNQWIYDKRGNDYKVKQSYEDDAYAAGNRAAKKITRTLTHWFKIGIWDGTKDMLEQFLAEPQYAIEALNSVQGREVGDC